jgi:BMFP domain-containing protein YqiC
VKCRADVERKVPAVQESILDKGKREEGQSLADIVEQLRQHVAALERELANYGSKLGFTDTARSLLARPQDD